MKELLISLVELFFEIDSTNKDYYLKDLFIVFLKVVAFLIIIVIVLYFLLNHIEIISLSN